MNSWQFYQYTQYPDNLNLHDEVQLRGLIKNYPYFQAAHLLLAKCLKNQDNYSFEKQLKLAALYAPNRSLLYSLLKSANKPVILEDIAFPVVEKTVEIPVSTEAEPMETVEAEIKVEPEIEVGAVDSIIETEPETVEETETPQTADTIETPTEAETVEPELPDGVIYITETITPEIIEEGKIIKDTVTEEPAIEEETMVADKIVEEPVVENQIAAEIIIEELYIEPVIEETVAQPIAERTFSDWLKQTASNGGSVFMGNKAGTTTLKQPETNYIIPNRPSENLAGQTMLTIAKAKPVETAKPTFSDEILEKFISSNPTISRPKTEFFNPSKAAKKSLEPDENLATETLAKIALKQGNYLKAIKIYEKLSLRFPEKFTIFATQIKKIKTENNLE